MLDHDWLLLISLFVLQFSGWHFLPWFLRILFFCIFHMCKFRAIFKSFFSYNSSLLRFTVPSLIISPVVSIGKCKWSVVFFSYCISKIKVFFLYKMFVFGVISNGNQSIVIVFRELFLKMFELITIFYLFLYIPCFASFRASFSSFIWYSSFNIFSFLDKIDDLTFGMTLLGTYLSKKISWFFEFTLLSFFKVKFATL